MARLLKKITIEVHMKEEEWLSITPVRLDETMNFIDEVSIEDTISTMIKCEFDLNAYTERLDVLITSAEGLSSRKS